MKNRAFTLTEMMMVVVLIGILASIAYPRYIRLVEKGRSAEARHVLGLIRDAELAYYLENDLYITTLTGANSLQVTVPTACNTSYYFRYGIVAPGGSSFTSTATRCTAGGKIPNGPSAFVVNITQNGNLDGTVGFI